MSERIISILMRRDKFTREEAEEQVQEAKKELQMLLDNGDLNEAYDICETWFRLEPDYLDDLM
jgi:hypothetical protein